MTMILETIIGATTDPWIVAPLHRLEHLDAVETVTLPREDMSRKRLRARTDKGTEIAIALDRATALFDGAVLLLDARAAIVVRMEPEQWLRLRPRDLTQAMGIGFFAGNLHWRVRFAEGELRIAVERDRSVYLERLADWLADGRVALLEEGAP